jgi:hypothetical protein
MVERCDRCAVVAQGENAEPGRVHPLPAQSEVASGPDLGLLVALSDILHRHASSVAKGA